MNEHEIRADVEKLLHTQITQAEWRHLKRLWFGGDLSSDRLVQDASEDKEEFRSFAKEHLQALRSYEKDKLREQAGELEPETSPGPTPTQIADIPTNLGDRMFQRSQALASLNWLRTGGRSSGRSAIHGTLLPRGGIDDTLAQWVYIVAVELWVPADELSKNFREMQRTLLYNPNPPKTQGRAFQVASFVWAQEQVHGERPPWPVLYERWNNWPLTEPFKDWRTFRRFFVRGAQATPPRYNATNEQMTALVRSRSHQGAFDKWAQLVRE
jgi:hypothetical protein